ncbi:MAG TPA: hypothetical protein VN653_00945, partial [Anaerolineales bacterium]|nr:hypothetical protein [Anaerolineales bacterium]
PGDVYVDCGEDIYNIWVEQKPCVEIDTQRCEGVYVVLIGSEPAQKEVSTKLAPPVVQVTLENCSPVYTSSTNICETDPIMVLTGLEPIPGYTITGIEGLYENQPFNCAAVCRLQLPATDADGFSIQFWAYSSYGDSSEIFDAQVRVAQSNEGNPDQTFWYVDVLSDQWVGVPLASCVADWGVLPPIGGPPEWLSTPTQSEKLGTDIPYNYLAANLITTGVVDASSCADNGILPDGGASACGMEVARPAVREWQNRFDELILNVAKDSGVPAHLLKNLFAKESQFWPGATLRTDIGLGQLTEHGADTTLLWNPPFFYQFCPLVMDSSNCKNGYLGLDEKQQEYTRLALIDAVNANCENCPLGIDLDRANFSISVFAQTLLANCGQAGQLVKNFTGGAAGKSASYEDLWKLTLVNYNAGPGCLGDALDATQLAKEELTWENISTHFSSACEAAVGYVNEISQ